MKPRKLDKILKLRELMKMRSAQTLAASRISYSKALEQAQALSKLALSYSEEHMQKPPHNVQELVLFRRFYAQLAYAGIAQAEIVSRRQATLFQDKFSYMRKYTDAKALAQLLASRDVAHKLETQRKLRRHQIHIRRPRLV